MNLIDLPYGPWKSYVTPTQEAYLLKPLCNRHNESFATSNKVERWRDPNYWALADSKLEREGFLHELN